MLRFSVFDYFQMTPGISSTQVQDSTTSSAFGSNTNENQYQIDGTNITSPTAGQMWPYPNTEVVVDRDRGLRRIDQWTLAGHRDGLRDTADLEAQIDVEGATDFDPHGHRGQSS